MLEILHGQFFVVLTTLVELTKPQNFTISNFNTLFELLYARLEPLVSFFEVFAAKLDLVRSFVCSSKFLSPFLVAYRRSSHCVALRGLFAFGVLAVKLMVHL